MSDVVPPLEYAWCPQSRRRKWSRILMMAASAMVLATGTWLMWAPFSRRITLFTLQRHCLNNSKPADCVVYSSDWTPVSPGAKPSLSRPESGLADPAWQRFYAVLSPPGARKAADILVHGRRTPGGAARLVAVSHSLGLMGESGQSMQFNATVVEPGNALSLPRIVSSDQRVVPLPPGKEINSVRVHAGQPDPKDRSHFAFSIWLDGREMLIDGWLQDDDTIKLEAREW